MRPLVLAFLFSILAVSVTARELPLRLRYPTKTEEFILTGVEDGSVVFRPMGRDTGGRAYLRIDQLEIARARLEFLFPEEFYDAIDESNEGFSARALPVIRRYAAPFLDYMKLSGLPGNMLSVVVTYLDVLSELERWEEAVDVAVRIPLETTPPFMMKRVSRLAEDLFEADRREEAERIHRHIVASGELEPDRMEVLMELAEYWRTNEEYERAFDLYRKVESATGPHRERAALWMAYCRIYLGQPIEPEPFFAKLPEMAVSDPGYSLRELVKALVLMNEEEPGEAMRRAATGKTYANAAEAWYPELLYLVAVLYRELGLSEASVFAHREVSTLYPDTLWGERSSRILTDTNP